MNVRYLPSAFMASAITFSLFFAMQMLVSENQTIPPSIIQTKFIPSIREVKPPEPFPGREMPKKIVIEELPPLPPEEGAKPSRPDGISVPRETITTKEIINDPIFGVSDGDIIPLTKVAPSYPPRAAERGIEGSVVLEFTISKTGSVENIRVVEATPPGYFERESIKALAKFKYKPRIVGGQPVAVDGVRHLISFEMPK